MNSCEPVETETKILFSRKKDIQFSEPETVDLPRLKELEPQYYSKCQEVEKLTSYENK